jgi:2-hydroxy-6-oxonona-2,4-dienedioate hydrolase
MSLTISSPVRWTRRAVIAAGMTAMLAQQASAEDFPWRLPKLRRTRVHGHHMAYYEVGSGPPLVLVHGGSGSPALEWGRVVMPLSRKFRVIAPYLIGFGPSDQPPLPYDAGTFVDYLGEFLKARAAHGATLVGESLGGWVVGHYALRQGGKSSWGQSLPRISHLVFVDGAVQVHPGDGGGAQQSINSPSVGKLAHDFYVKLPKVDNGVVLKALGPHMLAQQVRDDQLQMITTPTLVIWGHEDKILPLKDGRHIAAQIPGARIVIIENSGHIPAVEQPRAFLAALGGFPASRG